MHPYRTPGLAIKYQDTVLSPPFQPQMNVQPYCDCCGWNLERPQKQYDWYTPGSYTWCKKCLLHYRVILYYRGYRSNVELASWIEIFKDVHTISILESIVKDYQIPGVIYFTHQPFCKIENIILPEELSQKPTPNIWQRICNMCAILLRRK
jgi:hypothetical protein